MKDIDDLPDDEKMHFTKCTKCGEYFDMRVLAQIFGHLHLTTRPKQPWTSVRKVGYPEEYLNGQYKLMINLN